MAARKKKSGRRAHGDKTDATNTTGIASKRALLGFMSRALAHKERFIIEQYYQYGHTMREIGEMLAFTETEVKSIHSSIMLRLRGIRQLYDQTTEPPPRHLVEAVQAVSLELVDHIQKHPQELHRIRPRQFEELIAEILLSFGWEVQLTPPTRDGGYDIFAISNSIAGIRSSWIVECKKYSSHRKVGVDIARELYGAAMKLDRGNVGMILATTSSFTKGAEELASSTYNFELRDYDAVLGWINECRPNPDGNLYLRDTELIVPGQSD